MAAEGKWSTPGWPSIDPDWNPAWPATRQRHYAAAHELLAEEDPGSPASCRASPLHDMDIGKWLAKQRQHTMWAGLIPQQRERLEQLGVTPLPTTEQEAPGKPARTALAPSSEASRPCASTRPAPAP
ncbi:hypothetical protein GCM10010218_65790 [Streptomyces mashuensis]|uniref:Helicase-associated domain-containing protein n=1 Tax=Streptomyces mashuensis TaxID=33904 RepID=A0A919BAT5_9ACTN|nr:helicase associated domain-containing protein [Streptomyces mashuensis]GHF75700.1 hypothetical protein GCM10010218_65790 [Streptomyces mashuensis]